MHLVGVYYAVYHAARINDFKNGYQPRTTIVKDDKLDLVADCHSIMARWRNYFSQLLNVHEVNDIRKQKYTQ